MNVGGTNRCQPALIAKQLARFDIVNIGAVGTFVIGENVSESALRAAIARKLLFKCEIMICSARDCQQACIKGSVLTTAPGPKHSPVRDDWLPKMIAIQDRFALGLYRRQMKAISYLGSL